MSRFAPTEQPLPNVHIPLPIYPADVPGRWDEHHAFFESDDPLLQGEDFRPVRWSRLQFTPRRLHSNYHNRFDAVTLPEADDQRFQTTLLGAAGYIPGSAVDISQRRTVVREFDEATVSAMRSYNAIRIQQGTRWKIGFYFARHILQNGLQAVRETEEVGRFLEAASEQERARYSFTVIRAAASVVLDAVEPAYEIARKQGYIRRPEPTAVRFMMRHFNERQPDYVEDIQEKLNPVAA